MKANCAFVKGRFTGDPSYEYEHTETKRNEEKETDAELEEEKTVSIKTSNKNKFSKDAYMNDISIFLHSLAIVILYNFNLLRNNVVYL